MTHLLLRPLVLASLVSLGTAPSRTATPSPLVPSAPTDDWCDAPWGWTDDDREIACEVREQVTQAEGLDLAATNGSVSVSRWDRTDVLVRSRVLAAAPTQTEADRLVDETRITIDGGRVRDSASRTEHERDRWVSVSYQVFAPAGTDLEVAVLNGPLDVHGLSGRIRATATNGPVRLAGVGGDVVVRATNGPVDVNLEGDRWTGQGLDVTATNGPIRLAFPDDYSARLSAETHQGRIRTSGFSLPERNRKRGQWTGDSVDTTLGAGGPALLLRAQNGPVHLRRGL
ncbi:hypothetical protein [Rubrivirga sp. IMCC43871]|uniref:hypothetical protein n=1 Tax=Rubrivirga sp. IMCC43871 TaxID=3391575 RepID=UPI0039900FC8